jgi:hypothetical protein
MASWNDRSWPLRRWLCDRLIGDNAYSRNVATPPNVGGAWPRWSTQPPFKPYDQEAS